MVFGKGVEFVLVEGSIIIWAELGIKLIGHLAILGQNGGYGMVLVQIQGHDCYGHNSRGCKFDQS